LFFGRGWTGQIRLNLLEKLVFWRSGLLPDETVNPQDGGATHIAWQRSALMADVLNAGTQFRETEAVDARQQLDLAFRPDRLIARAARRDRREIVCEEEFVINLARSLRAYIMKMRIQLGAMRIFEHVPGI
jgi:hypothetical protein